jgi:ParB family transcriptional regulator, chromosome partitioning protein
MDEAFATQVEPETKPGTVALERTSLVLTYAHLRIREPSAEARLLASLSAAGQSSPVIVVRDAEGRTVLIDGYRRVRALGRLGSERVIALVLELHEADALVYCHRLETSRRRSALEDGWLVRELYGQGPPLHDISCALGRSTSWVSRRLALVRVLPQSVEEAVRRGLTPPHGAMKSLVPLARANKAHCEELVVNLDGQRVTTRQIAALYAAWRSGDPEQKERIVKAPRLFLKAVQSAAAAQPRDELGWLVRQLGAAGEALTRAAESLERAAEGDPRVTRNVRVQRAWRPVAAAWEALRSAMLRETMEGCGARPGHPGRDLGAQG